MDGNNARIDACKLNDDNKNELNQKEAELEEIKSIKKENIIQPSLIERMLPVEILELVVQFLVTPVVLPTRETDQIQRAALESLTLTNHLFSELARRRLSAGTNIVSGYVQDSNDNSSVNKWLDRRKSTMNFPIQTLSLHEIRNRSAVRKIIQSCGRVVKRVGLYN